MKREAAASRQRRNQEELKAGKDIETCAQQTTHASRAEGPALSVCRAALQRKGRADPNEITVFKMSIN